MISNRKHIANGSKYDKYFDYTPNKTVVIRESVSVPETLSFMIQRAKEVQYQTKKLSLEVLKGNNLQETCRNIWNFVYNHIAYEEDTEGFEDVRDPVRLWKDKIGDCDCYSLFIATCLHNLNIRFKFRVTSYGPRETVNGFLDPQWEHIYVIVPTKGGKHITIDCVADKFNYEHPYHSNKDWEGGKAKSLNGYKGLSIDPVTITAIATTTINLVKNLGIKLDSEQGARVAQELQKWENEFVPKLTVIEKAATKHPELQVPYINFVEYYNTEVQYALENYTDFKGGLLFNNTERRFDDWKDKRYPDLKSRLETLSNLYTQITGVAIHQAIILESQQQLPTNLGGETTDVRQAATGFIGKIPKEVGYVAAGVGGILLIGKLLF